MPTVLRRYDVSASPRRPVTSVVRFCFSKKDQTLDTALERLSVRNSIANLRSFPYVSELEAKGELTLHGAWFDISTGELWVMNTETGDFERPDLG